MDANDIYRMGGAIASALAHLKTAGITHGDVAARNIILEHNFTPKLSDFAAYKKAYSQDYYRQVI